MNRTVSLPDDLLKRAEALAARERVSLEEFLSMKLSEQLADLEYLQKRADRASREKFQAAMGLIPGDEPEEYDRF